MKVSNFMRTVVWAGYLVILVGAILAEFGTVGLQQVTTLVLMGFGGIMMLVEGMFEGEMGEFSNPRQLDSMITVLFGLISIFMVVLSITEIGTTILKLVPAVLILQLVVLFFEGVRNRTLPGVSL